MARLFKKRKERKEAEELARKAALKQLRDENRAKRAEKAKSLQEAAKVKKSKSPGSVPTAPSRVIVDGKTYTSQKAADMAKAREESKKAEERTKRGLGNIKARREAKVGEAYQRTEASGKVSVKRKSDPSKRNQPKPILQESSSNVKSDKKEFGKHSISKYGSKGKQTFRSKPRESLEDFKKRINPKLKHGGALAIMIAPVKTKKMKAIKKGAKAEKGGKVKKVKKKDKKSLEAAQKALERRASESRLNKYDKKHVGRIGNTAVLDAPGKRKKAFTDMETETIARGVAKKEGRVYKRAMYGAKMKKKAMYGAKMKK
jgi:hypothetical protein